MKATTFAFAIALCSLPLGGCQTLFGDAGFAARSPEVDTASVDLSGYFTVRLEAGKAHLIHNRPALAVVAFRQASYDPAHAARAYNGMGVAYAQMGRSDLAQKYFEMAIAADPTDGRFSANLAKLEAAGNIRSAEPQFAERDESSETHAALAATLAAPLANNGVALAVPGTNSTPALTRISSGEVRINSLGTGRNVMAIVSAARAEASPSLESRALRRNARAAGHPARVEWPGRTERSTYPVRIALAEANPRQSSPYPLRIELPKSR